VTTVPAALGRTAPIFVFANYADYGYFLVRLDSMTVRALEGGAIGRVDDPFLRTMLWGALWDQVRSAAMPPARFAKLLLAELPRERDEQIVPVLVGRLERAIRAYLTDADRDAVRADAERVLWQGAGDASKPYGIRKAFLDAFVAVAASRDAVAKLNTLLAADSAAGEPVRDPTRWEVVNRLIVLSAPGSDAALAAQSARDTTPDGRRRTFTAGAAHSSAGTKATFFNRYFADKTLNEDWASGSLGAFNAVEHQQLTLSYLRPALDSLPYIQANRRIFFLGSWLGAFMNGQTSAEALAVVQRYLKENPALPADLRQKVLQNADELERTVRIRAAQQVRQ
jgi:aminopeptidase N